MTGWAARLTAPRLCRPAGRIGRLARSTGLLPISSSTMTASRARGRVVPFRARTSGKLRSPAASRPRPMAYIS